MQKLIPVLLNKQYLFNPIDNTLSELGRIDNKQQLGSNEARALWLLVSNKGKLVTREQLFDYVWYSQGFQVDGTSLNQTISVLRKLLNEQIKDPIYIRTQPKRGYVFVADVSFQPIDVNTKKIDLVEDQFIVEPLVTEVPLIAEWPTEISPDSEIGSTQVTPTELANQSNNINDDSAAFIPQKKKNPYHSPFTPLRIMLMLLTAIIPSWFLVFYHPKVELNLIRIEDLKLNPPVQVYTMKGEDGLIKDHLIISHCVLNYFRDIKRKEGFQYLLVTANQFANMVYINFVYKPQYAEKNITINLFGQPLDQDNNRSNSEINSDINNKSTKSGDRDLCDF